MSSRDRAEAVLTRMRPFIQADGGDIEVVDVEGEDVYVRLMGHCAACPQARMTLHFGLEVALRAEMPGVRVVRVA
jgi:Fe-S cluster biogenesis protein NfuA